ncbi:hypothetical protein LguiB_029374 [Lonicera macranthoides]
MAICLFFLTLLFFTTPLNSSPILESRFIKSLKNSTQQNYFELTHPLPSDFLSPTCTLLLLNHSFADTIGKPPVSAPYSPPNNCDWSHAVLQFTASCKGEQYDRIAAVWLEGSELLRTSTPEPTEDGVFWKVRKDVTRYSSLLSKPNLTLTVMLENVVNDVFTGIYHVNISILYYFNTAGDAPAPAPSPSTPANRLRLNRKLAFEVESDNLFKLNSMIISQKATDSLNDYNEKNIYKSPADLIIPISRTLSDEGFWFRITNGSVVQSKGIQIPNNTYKAVLEVYVSFHGDDEFWYSNPPDSYIQSNNLTTGRGHGAYREVFVNVDGNFVGSVIPFPVIFTGGINPLFWEPVVAIGAFNVPSYPFLLTPFLGQILDGKEHFFELGVADSIQFWLVDANLHLWFDHESAEVQAQSIDYKSPKLKIQRESSFRHLDGTFKVDAKRKSHFTGWVNSSSGNLTTHIIQKIKFRNSIKFYNNGTEKSVHQKIKNKIEIRVESGEGMVISRSKMKIRYPLTISISNLPWSENDTTLMMTSVDHGFKGKFKGELSGSVHSRQNSSGWMIVKDHDVLSGSADTYQVYDFKNELGCYSRTIDASNGWLIKDNSSFSCSSFS